MPASTNRTINFCDLLSRKAQFFYDEFRGNNVPQHEKVTFRPKTNERRKTRLFDRRSLLGSSLANKIKRQTINRSSIVEAYDLQIPNTKVMPEKQFNEDLSGRTK